MKRTLVTICLGLALALMSLSAGCGPAASSEMTAINSADGLGLRFNSTGHALAVTVDGNELPSDGMTVPGGFYLRSAGATGETPISGSAMRTSEGLGFAAAPAGLRMWAALRDCGDHIEIHGRLNNPAGNERGVTVGLRLPVNGADWLFGRSILQSELIGTTQLYAEWTCADSDWDGRQINHGMITPIYGETAGLALGATADHPQIFRVYYQQGRGFCIEADLGLSPVPVKYHNSATFKFVLYRFDPKLRYRGALAKYFAMTGADYKVRSAKFGNWIATASLNKIKAKAADYSVVFDSHGARYFKEAEQQGVYAFEYSRGHYDVVPIYAGTPANPIPPPEVIRRAVQFTWAAQANQTQQGWKRDPSPATQAEMDRTSVTWGPDWQIRTWNVEGPYNYEPRLFPNGYMAADLPTNPDPKIDRPNQGEHVLCWNFGVPLTEAHAGNLKYAGHHFDGWADFSGRYLENYRPSHFRTIEVPLTYSHWTGRPVQFHAFMWQELSRPLAEYLHSQHMMLFANDRPWRMSVMFDQPMIDIHGGSERTERNLAYMAYMRTLVGSKPISGTGIGQDEENPDKVYSPRELAQFERDLNILVPYCWFPGAFGPKELWQRYCPVMQQMAAAGWQPVTGATTSHPDLLVERWGDAKTAKVFYAVHNRSEAVVSYELTIDLALVKIDPKVVDCIQPIGGYRYPFIDGGMATTTANTLVLRSTLGGRRSAVFELARQTFNTIPVTSPDPSAAPVRLEPTVSSIRANVKLTAPLSPLVSTIPALAPWSPASAGSPAFAATLRRLGLRPMTADRFLHTYALEKRELANAIAFHLANEKVTTDLDKTATELANWLAPRFDGIYEAELPAPAMTIWLAMRGYYRNPQTWQMVAKAQLANPCSPKIASKQPLVPEDYVVTVFDPLMEKPQ